MWDKIVKAVNSDISTPLNELIKSTANWGLPETFWRTATGEIVLLKDMRLRVYAIGQGGTANTAVNGGGGGGGGCAVDEREYRAGDVIVCDITSARTIAVCQARGLSVQANVGGSAGNSGGGGLGGTALGGNVSNFTGGRGGNNYNVANAVNIAGEDSDGCGGGAGRFTGSAMSNLPAILPSGGNGGVSGGNGAFSTGWTISLTANRNAGNGGDGGLFGGRGSDGFAANGTTNVMGMNGGVGGNGGINGGNGGNGGNAASAAGPGSRAGSGGNGGNGGINGGNGGSSGVGGATTAVAAAGVGGRGGLGVGGNGGTAFAPAILGSNGGGNYFNVSGSRTANTLGGIGASAVINITNYPPNHVNYGGGNFMANNAGMPLVFIEEVV